MPTKQKHPSHRVRTLVRWAVFAAVSAAVFGASAPAEARCVTVGADGVTHTQCKLP